MQIEPGEAKPRILAAEAKRWVGLTELGGDNRGQVVEMFQKAVDGKASGEAWCLSFVQFCIKQVDVLWDEMTLQTSGMRSRLYPTEHVLTCWNQSPKEHRLTKPEPGCLILWNHTKDGKPTSLGHAGIVIEVNSDGTCKTVEGNTGDGAGVVREGDGVYKKNRKWDQPAGSMVVLGFLKVWS